MESKPLVSISCLSFNHVTFIKDCLDSFLMQKTTFPFEIIIYDDCSTDGTKEIIEEYALQYPQIIFPTFQEINQYSRGVRGMRPKFSYNLCRGKYIASCDGDDFWTDPYKLQKQVDFLEANPNYSACAHLSNIINYKEASVNESELWQKHDGDKNLKLQDVVSLVVPFQTSSFVFNRKVLDDLYSFYNKWHGSISGDIVLYTISCKSGPIRLINEKMSTYRVHSGGITSNKSKRNNLKGLLNKYTMWSLLGNEFSEEERRKYFNKITGHFEDYIFKNCKKASIGGLLEEMIFFLKSNPIKISTKLKLVYRIIKYKALN